MCAACIREPSSPQHRILEQVGPQMPKDSTLSSHLPHVQQRREGNRVSVGRHLPSCSHLCFTRVPCYQLDSDRKTRHRKQPLAPLTASTSSCTWRRRLWNRKTGKTLCLSLEKRKVRTTGGASWDSGAPNVCPGRSSQGTDLGMGNKPLIVFSV